MVERIWSARASSLDGAAAYAAYFQRVVVPELAARARVSRRQAVAARARRRHRDRRRDRRGTSLDVIHGFAGDDIESAVVHDEAAAFFIDYDRTVRHFDIVCEDR